jgi:hypothetical protein
MRLVVAGTPGAGKSTFVRTVSDIQVVDTDRVATDETALLKQRTTVAFDFGRIAFGSTMDLQIYGTPGQSRFNFMWDFLIQRAHCYLLLVPAHRPTDFHYARQIVSFMNQRVQIPMFVGVTHTDCPGASTPDEIMLRLGYRHDRNRPPVVLVNPNERASVMEALMTGMALLIAHGCSDVPTKAGSVSQSTPHPTRNVFNFAKP